MDTYVIKSLDITFSSCQAVDWGVFGLDGRDGGDSTMWIGSSKAYTPCHQDTYGFNLVAQIAGRWAGLYFTLPNFDLLSMT